MSRSWNTKMKDRPNLWQFYGLSFMYANTCGLTRNESRIRFCIPGTSNFRIYRCNFGILSRKYPEILLLLLMNRNDVHSNEHNRFLERSPRNQNYFHCLTMFLPIFPFRINLILVYYIWNNLNLFLLIFNKYPDENYKYWSEFIKIRFKLIIF